MKLYIINMEYNQLIDLLNYYISIGLRYIDDNTYQKLLEYINSTNICKGFQNSAIQTNFQDGNQVSLDQYSKKTNVNISMFNVGDGKFNDKSSFDKHCYKFNQNNVLLDDYDNKSNNVNNCKVDLRCSYIQNNLSKYKSDTTNKTQNTAHIVSQLQNDDKKNNINLNYNKELQLKLLFNKIKNQETDLKNMANNIVLGDGNINAKVMIIGEAPGAEEDEVGVPFVGRSGKLLRQELNNVGLCKNMIYITNIVPWRPYNNRKPTQNEIQLFLPFILDYIKIIQPKIILTAGSISSQSVLNINDTISQIRNYIYLASIIDNKINCIKKCKIIDFDCNIKIENQIIIVPTFHPAYILRATSKKELLQDDLQNVVKILTQLQR